MTQKGPVPPLTSPLTPPSTPPIFLQSRDNPLIKDLRRLAQGSTAYRKQQRIWLEGDHLCRAALARAWVPELAVYSESFWPLAQAEYAHHAIKNIVVADAVWADISALESPARMAFVLARPAQPVLQPHISALILDRVQDAGNVGSMLRSAAAFGVDQVLALRGTAALWSPKVLRAGMGAHFALRLHEGLALQDLDGLTVPIVVTSSHQGGFLHQQTLPQPCAWAMGHEGQGVSEDLMARAALQVRIAQPGGEESLNVAAAAAICLYASSMSAT